MSQDAKFASGEAGQEGKKGARALVVGPYFNRRAAEVRKDGHGGRTPESRLAEAEGLATAIDLDVTGTEAIALAAVRPATYIGKGKVDEIAARVASESIELVMFDCALSPIQQRNLEKAFSAKVIDRTGLILEIFGQRAHTREGALQVELAHLSYQKSRLVRSWTHLERQRGGFGFLGGPGETQIETDRRLIQERIIKIGKELESVAKTRGLHRKTRRDATLPVVALVGYTNAGKSTLFNRLTQADRLAKDMLFATLDPTLRALPLPQGGKALLSDTVGFISDLPTMLVSAFRATLEEVLQAELIVHVRDISHDDADAQAEDVARVLCELGVNPNDHERIVEVWNKVDRLDEARRAALADAARRRPARARPVMISSTTGEGLAQAAQEIATRLRARNVTLRIDIAPEDGSGANWAYENLDVLDRQTAPDGVAELTVSVAPEKLEQARRRFPGARVAANRRARRARA